MFRYFGSKASTAAFVADVGLDGLTDATVADAFGGLGNIGAEFKRRGCMVTTCDILSFPNAFQHARIACQRTPSFSRVRRELRISSLSDLLETLNTIDRPSRWFVREYSKARKFFTPENARRIGSAWAAISRWNRHQWLSDSERKFAIASLLNSADACANTAGTYYAYLKTWHRKALNPFAMQWLSAERGRKAGIAMQGDAFNCLSEKTFDLLYLDPPYNNRDYSRYYHLPETLARLTSARIDEGSKAGQPIKRAMEGIAIRDAMKLPYLVKLIEAVHWKRLVVQYADGAYIPKKQLRNALNALGDVTAHRVPALGYRTTQGTRYEEHHVFIVDR